MLFLYREVNGEPLGWLDEIVRAKRPTRLPVVLTDLTESRRGKDHVATTWALVSRKRAPWRWVPPIGIVQEHGTAVRLRLANPLSPLLDAGFLEATLRRHFAPLFDAFFDDILRPYYPAGVRFDVNRQPIAKSALGVPDASARSSSRWSRSTRVRPLSDAVVDVRG